MRNTTHTKKNYSPVVVSVFKVQQQNMGIFEVVDVAVVVVIPPSTILINHLSILEKRNNEWICMVSGIASCPNLSKMQSSLGQCFCFNYVATHPALLHLMIDCQACDDLPLQTLFSVKTDVMYIHKRKTTLFLWPCFPSPRR